MQFRESSRGLCKHFCNSNPACVCVCGWVCVCVCVCVRARFDACTPAFCRASSAPLHACYVSTPIKPANPKP